MKKSYDISIKDGLIDKGNKANKEIKEFKRYLHRHTYTLNADAIDALAYPPAKELSFVNSTMTITERNYRAFLDAREKIITCRFITNLYKS